MISFSIQRLLLICGLGTLCPIGFLLNLIIILTIFLNTNLHTTTYILYLHLAGCDILLTILGGSLGITVYVTGEYIYCKCAGAMITLTYIVCIGSVVLISYDRYIYLQMPFLYTKRVTKRRVYIGLLITWLIGFFDVILPLVLHKMYKYEHTYIGYLNRLNCVFSRIWQKEFLLLTTIGFICIPTILIAILNVKIFQLASYHHMRIQQTTIHLQSQNNRVDIIGKKDEVAEKETVKKTKKQKETISISEIECYESSEVSNYQLPTKTTEIKVDRARRLSDTKPKINTDIKLVKDQNLNALQKNYTTNKVDKITTKTQKKTKLMLINRKAVRTTLCIVITNLLCTLPYIFVLILEAICNYCISYKKIRYGYSLFLLNYLTSILNPLIYTLTNSELRRHVKKLFQCCFIYCNSGDKLTRSRRSSTSVSATTIRKISSHSDLTAIKPPSLEVTNGLDNRGFRMPPIIEEHF